jgi:hypothetical protein
MTLLPLPSLAPTDSTQCHEWSDVHVQVIGATIAYENRVMEVIDCADFPEDIGTPRGTSGCVVLQGTTTLAGSCTTMHAIFAKLVSLFRLTISQAIEVCQCTSPLLRSHPLHTRDRALLVVSAL